MEITIKRDGKLYSVPTYTVDRKLTLVIIKMEDLEEVKENEELAKLMDFEMNRICLGEQPKEEPQPQEDIELLTMQYEDWYDGQSSIKRKINEIVVELNQLIKANKK